MKLRFSVQHALDAQLAQAELPVVVAGRGPWLDEVDEVGVGGLEVLNDGP